MLSFGVGGFYFMLFLQLNSNAASLWFGSGDSVSALDLALRGGILMIPLTVMFVAVLYVFLERLFAMAGVSKLPAKTLHQVQALISAGNPQEALHLCNSRLPALKVLAKGISRLGSPISQIESAMEKTAKLELYQLEKRLGTLAVIAGIAPMLGFLGTVLGITYSFMTVSQVQRLANPQLLSTGIYTALITTIAGLIVGLSAYCAYNYLVSRVHQAVYTMEWTVDKFLDFLAKPITPIQKK
jgi:biopolymer transport protein ExbB